MNTLSVGEVIAILQRFHPSMPFFKSSISGGGYEPVVNTGNFIYRIIEGRAITCIDPIEYKDAEPETPGSFDAIVL